MIAVERIGPERHEERRWHHGRRITMVIAREGPEEDFVWRLSMASVPEPGPFSIFPPYIDRTLLLLEGEGLSLDFGVHGRVRLERRFGAVAFAGNWVTQADLLGGPVRDLNLMVDRRRVSAAVAVLEGETSDTCADVTLLYALEGQWQAALGGDTYVLAYGELLVLRGGAGVILQIAGEGHLLRADLTEVGHV
jgi:uncharacterized protein